MCNNTTAAFPAGTEDRQTAEPDPADFLSSTELPAVPLTEAELQTLDAALEHPSELNRHRTALLRMAANLATAYSLYLQLTQEAATHGLLTLATDDDRRGHGINWWVQRYTKRGLLEPEEEQTLVTVMMQVARYAVGFPIPVTSDEFHQLTCHPQALVRAAYAVARDMAA